MHNFTGCIFNAQIEAKHSEVDIEFTRSGISAMTRAGQIFEISFSQCVIRTGGVGRRLLFCHNCDRSVTICCSHKLFPKALCEASLGLLDAQLDRQLKSTLRKAPERSFLGINILIGVALIVLGMHLIARI
jgi:hypothetical protein